jgi:hypothetical protein
VADPAFVPQPYPLYALTLVKLDHPTRFEPTDPPVRLVVGWTASGNDGALPLPVLAYNGLTVWEGIASYYPDRDTAEAMGRQFAKASRQEMRGQALKDLFAAFEAKLDR